jgi:hypothetical protein
MIHYMNKGDGLLKQLASMRVTLVWIDGVLHCDKPEELSDDDINTIIAEYNPWPVEKAAKLAEINDWFEDATKQLVAGIPDIEQKSWPQQLNEAYGVRPLSMLLSMAQGRGITVEDLIAKIKYKADQYNQFYGYLQGRRDAVEDQIKAMPDSGQLDRLPELWALSCTV